MPTSQSDKSERAQRGLNLLLVISGAATLFLFFKLIKPSEAFNDRTIMWVLKNLTEVQSNLQREAVENWLLLDYIFAICYTLFFFFLTRKALRFTSGRSFSVGKRVGWLILGFAAFGLLENTIQLAALKGHQAFVGSLPVLAVLKWGGPLLGTVFFLAVHPRRIRFLRLSLGTISVVAMIVIVIRLFVCHVSHYPPQAVATSRVPETQAQIQSNLKLTVATLSMTNPANVFGTNSSRLADSAAWISERFSSNGYTPSNWHFSIKNPEKYSFGSAMESTATNIIAELKGTHATNPIVIIGAHYDTMAFSTDWTGTKTNQFQPDQPGTPGANDNASGVAAMLEIARLIKNVPAKTTVRFVAFANEEPPFFQKADAMGSWHYAENCSKANERVLMMISLDALAVYDPTNRGSYKRAGLKGVAASFLGLKDETDYVAFMSNWDAGSGRKAKEWADIFSRHASISVRTVSLPFISGEVFAWSDDWSFTRHGYPAFTVTDTAFYRSPRYHEQNDAYANLSASDFQGFTEVVYGLSEMVKEMITK